MAQYSQVAAAQLQMTASALFLFQVNKGRDTFSLRCPLLRNGSAFSLELKSDRESKIVFVALFDSSKDRSFTCSIRLYHISHDQDIIHSMLVLGTSLCTDPAISVFLWIIVHSYYLTIERLHVTHFLYKAFVSYYESTLFNP